MPRAFASPVGVAARGFSVVGAVSVLTLGLVLPVFGVRAWSAGYADRLGNTIAQGLACVLTAANQRATASQPAEPIDDVSAPSGDSPSSPSVALASKRPHSTSKAHSSPITHGVRVSSAQVLSLAARRAMPLAVPVKANAQHPAGLLLRGVSGMGIGMQDGDVLTEAAGQKATSVAVVVGVVLAARGRQVPEISGRFFRGGVLYALTVEQPYPKQPLPG